MVMDPGVSWEDSLLVIDNDLPWTFSWTEFYNAETPEGLENKAILKRVL